MLGIMMALELRRRRIVVSVVGVVVRVVVTRVVGMVGIHVGSQGRRHCSRCLLPSLIFHPSQPLRFSMHSINPCSDGILFALQPPCHCHRNAFDGAWLVELETTITPYRLSAPPLM